MVPRDFFVDLGVIHVPTDFHPCTLKWAPGLQFKGACILGLPNQPSVQLSRRYCQPDDGSPPVCTERLQIWADCSLSVGMNGQCACRKALFTSIVASFVFFCLVCLPAIASLHTSLRLGEATGSYNRNDHTLSVSSWWAVASIYVFTHDTNE